MMYIITIDSSFIRDAQYADTIGLSDSEIEGIYMDSDLDYLWKDFYPEHFLGIIEASSKEEAITKVASVRKHDPRILKAYSIDEVRM